MKSVPLIHISWLKPFVDFFDERKVSLQAYWEEPNLSRDLILSGDAWITKHQLYSFLNSVAKGEKMPEIGFLVGETMTPETLGPIGTAMGKADTLGEALRIACRLIHRSSENNTTWIEEGESGEVWFHNRTHNPFPAQRDVADHAGLMTLINFVRTASELDWYPEKAQLQSVRSRAHTQIAGFKNSQVEYETSSTGFSFPAEWLLHPVHIHGISSNSSESNAFLDQNESEEQKFRRLLHTLVGAGGMAPTVKLTAQLLDISPRSLHRWLADQGFTYRGLLDEIRQERARDLLTGSDLSIKEIAYELGYSGPNNFIRAFKRLSGLSPGEYRERHS